MNMNHPLRTVASATAIALGLTFAASPAAGLTVQSATGATLPDVPLEAIGTWGNNAAAVAVAPGWVLTTRHQDVLGSPPDRTVVIDGVSYTADVDNQILFDSGGTTVDLRLVPLLDGSGDAAELTSFVEVYDGSVSALGSTISAITGFGPEIGTAQSDGFDWMGNLNSNNNPLNVGQNRISSLDTISDGTFTGMSVLVADFDDPATTGLSGAVDFEATGAGGDSGGGWFINDGGEWKLLGLSHAVQLDGDDDGSAGTTNDDFIAQAFFSQQFIAVDVREFAGTINSIPEPTSLALLASGSLFLATRRRGVQR